VDEFFVASAFSLMRMKLAKFSRKRHNSAIVFVYGDFMPHFFISYAKKDTRELAIALSDALNAVPNVTAWVDRSLRVGSSWELQIQNEIDKCDYFVVLYSPDINRHKKGEEPSYVLKEISYAVNTLKKPVIPVMAQKTEPPFSLNDVHYIDYTIVGLSLDDLLEAICDEASLSLGKQSIVSVPLSVQPKPAPVGTVSKPYVVGDITKGWLPKPFDWCKIPAGKVTLGKGLDFRAHSVDKSFDIPEFLMAKYPVTNAQFNLFISQGGYENQQWWTEAGWHEKEQGRWKLPQFWRDSELNDDEQPVVGVSWYEALAFCLWLSEATGETIMLPTEQQWQRAAQGDDGRIYPWGNDIASKKANTKESQIGKTTVVTAYPNGASPYGVLDMVGNVWEKCLTDYDTGDTVKDGTSFRTIRGGAHNYPIANTGVAVRTHTYPVYRNNSSGFRITCSPQSNNSPSTGLDWLLS
jgi:formylglycine-generating enzyme required for sulfatase activity